MFKRLKREIREFKRCWRITTEVGKEWREQNKKHTMQELNREVSNRIREELGLELKMLEGMKSMVESMRVVNTSDPISEDDIKEYYERYLEKKKGDEKWEWTTEVPYNFEEYREIALERGWRFLMSSTSSCMIGGLDGKPPIFM